ncbi:MAG: NUDIX domain-containing protein [Clostridia bacterium]|nr:NUDIX domain-containing protein [Clostridia bacterium]
MGISIHESFMQYVKEKNSSKEEIDLYDENRKYIRTIYRGDTIKQSEWKKCVLCFVIDIEGNVIIEIKYDNQKDLCSGHIKHNEVATQAVLRELYEENGILFEEAMQVRHLDNIKISFEETNQELQCFLDVFCLFRTKEKSLRVNESEMKGIQRIPFKKFLEVFLNNEIFPYTTAYKPIVEKLEKLYQERFENNKVPLGIER